MVQGRAGRQGEKGQGLALAQNENSRRPKAAGCALLTSGEHGCSRHFSPLEVYSTSVTTLLASKETTSVLA
jgi:cytochrome P450